MERNLMLLLVILYSLTFYAGNKQENNFYSPRVGDELVKYSMDFKLPQNGVLDLRDYHIGTKEYHSKYISSNDTLPSYYCLIDNSALYYSHEKDDSLFLDGFENNQTKISYTIPLLHLVSSLKDGMEYTGNLLGKGIYSDSFDFTCEGNYHTQISRLSTVILPNNLSFSNALLLYRKENIEYKFAKSCSNIPQETTNEIWQVYIPGYRYPIVTFSQYHEEEGTTQASAYYYPQEEQPYLVGDLENQKERGYEELSNKELRSTKTDDFTFDIVQSSNKIYVNFSSLKNCSVSFVLANSSGMVLQTEKRTCKAGQDGVCIFSMVGLASGQYVVHADVEGKMFSEKFNVK